VASSLEVVGNGVGDGLGVALGIGVAVEETARVVAPPVDTHPTRSSVSPRRLSRS
jgi:hypothetical protein